MIRRGIYDTQGELFGFVEGHTVYNLEGDPVGSIRSEGKRRAAYALSGQKMWHLSGDGIYSLKWEPIGYLGSPFREHDPEGYDYD